MLLSNGLVPDSCTNQAPARPTPHIPGELGIWMLIAGDLTLFSLLFFLFLKYRAAQEVLFTEAQRHLSQALGLVNTLLMLTSSWLVASAVRAARRQQSQIASRCFAAAFGCGAGFIIVKYFEYGKELRAGFTPNSNDFFMYYYVYTGIHLIHVVIGMGALATLTLYVRTAGLTIKVQHLESGATFWHLVDLLWIVLFALLYLVGQS
jgi:nitric oxide reductase NorE protein